MENILGLEITLDKIRILELWATEKGWEPMHLGKLDLPANSTKDGIIVAPRLIADRISAYLKENKITTKKTIALINPGFFFTRIVRLPHNLSDSQIRMNLEAELNQYQAFSGKAAAIDFRNLEELSEEGIKKVNILFGAACRELTASYLKTTELAGLDLMAVDTLVLSMLRLLDEVDLESSAQVVTLLVVLGDRFLEMCVLKGNRPRFLHSVEIDLNYFDLDRPGFIERLLSAIKLVLNFYQARFVQGEPITRMLISPLDGKCSQIHVLLQERLPRIPIQLANTLNKVIIHRNKGIEPAELQFCFSGLLGAVLRVENKAGAFNLNLLSEQKTQSQSRKKQIYLFSILMGLVLGVMVVSAIWTVLRINILQAKISQISFNLEQPSPELNNALSLKEKNAILDRQIEEANSITSNKERFYFNKIAKAMLAVPRSLWLTEASLDKKSKNLVLKGESATEKALFDYKTKLSDIDYFETVEIASSESRMDNIRFMIRCKIK